MAKRGPEEYYSYQVSWSPGNRAHVATVAEFPSLSCLGPDRGQAMQGIVELVAEVIADMEEAGEEVPEPLGRRKYSGRLTLRLTPRQHRKAAMAAAREGVSLNRYIASRL